ncbi:hypothetical protein TH61_10665 [Rufibacter sp. DG15C]|uniref:energy transducer TonB n=1 Tax=Rufibacter sp. DG15C TaxID=1379909 RepID=UPI00078D19D3|nr:energy transducer TonB [Rufibacter sp. DG15C]AMM51543.1 hypothetical protein TH61_10665 [Rufibacter sp. DG15C]
MLPFSQFTKFYLRTLAFALCFLFTSQAYAQDTTQTLAQSQIDTTKVYVAVEQMPEFPGGREGLHQYLSSQFKYPKELTNHSFTGHLVYSFIIGTTGRVSDIIKLKGGPKLLEKEAERALQSMPTWTPGQQNGQNVRVKFTLPFKITPPKQPMPLTPSPEITITPDEGVYMVTEILPLYPGGHYDLNLFIKRKYQAPSGITYLGPNPMVLITTTLTPDGIINIGETKVVKGINPVIDARLVEVINQLKRFTPAYQNKEAVPFKLIFPIKLDQNGRVLEVERTNLVPVTAPANTD